MAGLLAYHADAEIARWTWAVAAVLGVAVLAGVGLAVRVPTAADSRNVRARVAFGLSAVAALFAPSGFFAVVVTPIALVQLAALWLSIAALRRVREQGGKMLAVAALALAGLALAYVLGNTTACLVTDACLH